MTTASQDPRNRGPETAGVGQRRWLALTVLAAMQFMLVMDVTVVTVALPKIQVSLHFSPAGLAWVINGYVLMAGGFLLLGGRLSDLFGRRRMFFAGVLIFGIASAACGAAVSQTMLVASRFVQGTGEALAGPAALGMIPVLFPDSRERTKALGIWGGIAGLGGMAGVVISGALTGLVSWRWIFYINIPVVVFALLMVPRVLSESRMARAGHRIDVPGAIGATGGLVAVVAGLLQAASQPWGSAQVLAPLLGGAALLVVTACWEVRSPDPLIPPRFFHNRTRVTANAVSVAFNAGFIGYVVLLTWYMQQVLGYSPLKTGLLWLPLGVGIGIGMGACTGLMPHIGVRVMLAIGFFGSAAGLFVASYIHAHSAYPSAILPGMFIFGLFSGICFPGLINGALHQLTGEDSGLGSGVQTAMQQVGSAVGLATLVTLAIRYAGSRIHAGVQPAVAQTGGYALAFRIAALLLAVGGALVLALLEHVDAKPRTALAEVPTAGGLPEREVRAGVRTPRRSQP